MVQDYPIELSSHGTQSKHIKTTQRETSPQCRKTISCPYCSAMMIVCQETGMEKAKACKLDQCGIQLPKAVWQYFLPMAFSNNVVWCDGRLLS